VPTNFNTERMQSCGEAEGIQQVVPCRGIYDNMRTAVDRVGRGKQRQINMRLRHE